MNYFKLVYKHFLTHFEGEIFRPVHKHISRQRGGACSLFSLQNTLWSILNLQRITGLAWRGFSAGHIWPSYQDLGTHVLDYNQV